MKPKPSPAPVSVKKVKGKQYPTELRLHALQAYVSAASELSVADLKEAVPELKDVPQDTLYTWRDKDQWTSRRASFQKDVYGKFLEAAASQMVKEYKTLLARLSPLESRVFDALMAQDFSAEEPAKLLTVYLKLQNAQASYAQEATRLALQPATGPQAHAPEKTATAALTAGEFTPEEAQAVAEALLRVRKTSSGGDS